MDLEEAIRLTYVYMEETRSSNLRSELKDEKIKYLNFVREILNDQYREIFNEYKRYEQQQRTAFIIKTQVHT